jgi:WXG100 family type VII secretion target
MSRLAVDLERLAHLVDRMARFEQHLGGLRDEVDVRVQALNATWTGEAAAAQASAHDQWRAGAAQVHEALAVLRTIATGAHANYAAAAAANRRMWSLP